MTTCEIELEDSYRLHRRFDRMGRLVGDVGMQTLFNAHVMVIGVGGVGSFAAEEASFCRRTLASYSASS